MIYKNAVIDDLPFIVDIYNSTIPGRMVTADTEPVTVTEKESWFYEHSEHHLPLWIILDDDENKIGWASFQTFYGRTAYTGTAEISIYLDESVRGKGYGLDVLNYCIGKAPQLNIHTLIGYIFSHNKPSTKLFLKAGFKEWGHLEDVAEMDGKFYSLKIFGFRSILQQ